MKVAINYDRSQPVTDAQLWVARQHPAVRERIAQIAQDVANKANDMASSVSDNPPTYQPAVDDNFGQIGQHGQSVRDQYSGRWRAIVVPADVKSRMREHHYHILRDVVSSYG